MTPHDIPGQVTLSDTIQRTEHLAELMKPISRDNVTTSAVYEGILDQVRRLKVLKYKSEQK